MAERRPPNKSKGYRWVAQQHSASTQPQSLEDVGSASDAAIDEDRDLSSNLGLRGGGNSEPHE